MKFITEEYLRDLYRKEPFNTYKLNQGQRLTPGAKQYLSDKRIKLEDDVMPKKVTTNNTTEKVAEKAEVKVVADKNTDSKKKLCRKLKSMEAVFLVTSSEILNGNIILAQTIINLGKKLSNIRGVIEGKCILENIPCIPCTGINQNNFREDLEDCFEITEFHMQFEKSSEILKIHSLRCELREIICMVEDAYGEDDDLGKMIAGNVNSIVNTLSQLICSTVGGIKCQKEN